MKIKRRYKIAILLVAIGFLVFLPHNNVLNEISEIVSKDEVINKNETSEEQKAKVEEEKRRREEREAKKQLLLQTLSANLSVNESFSVGVYDINNAEFFGVNELDQFHAASVMKLLVATTAFTDIERGKYELSTTVQNHMQQMVNQSNNNSWEYFNQLQGFDHQQEISDELALTNVKVWGNLMSTKGVSELLLKLYKGEILTEEHRKLFFSYMQNTETENRISLGVPEGTNFYHKTGTYQGGIHDAAIVIHPKNPFILVIFTNDTKGAAWETRFKSIQEATTSVYNYFSEL